MLDSWIVGRPTETHRNYVIHATYPRFVIEIIALEDGRWRAGALEWIDDPGGAEAARWSAEAGEQYFRAIKGREPVSFRSGEPTTFEENSSGIRAALVRAEGALRDAIVRSDPFRAGDAAPLKDLQEVLGVLAGWRVGLEAGRWEGRSCPPDGDRDRP